MNITTKRSPEEAIANARIRLYHLETIRKTLLVNLYDPYAASVFLSVCDMKIGKVSWVLDKPIGGCHVSR